MIAKHLNFDDIAIAFQSKSDKQLKKAYWLFWFMNKPYFVKIGGTLLNWFIKIGFPVAWALRPTAYAHFCGGDTLDEAGKVVRKLQQNNIGAILDYSVEGACTDDSFNSAASEIKRAIVKASTDQGIPFAVFKVTGIGSKNLLAAKQAQTAFSANEQLAWQKLEQRFYDICVLAKQLQVRLLIDAEESWIQDVIDSLSLQMMQAFNQEKAIVFNTFQFYKKDMPAKLYQAYQDAVAGNYILGAKIVRGAYMEKERDRALEMGYPSPIFSDKLATDRAFDGAIGFCIEHLTQMELCVGTHNEASCRLLAETMAANNIINSDKRVWFAQLYGMSDHISYTLAHDGYNVAKYVPYGPVEAVIPYLMRRAKENTAIGGQSSRELLLINQEMKRRGIGL